MNFETSRIIDSNGQKYRVGWDEHGWFTIQMINLRPATEGTVDEADTVEYDGEEWVVSTVGDYPNSSFYGDGVTKLIDAIKDKP